MHHFTASTDDGQTFFNFNSDMSGDVRIIHKGNELSVPGAHLIEFIANYVRRERVAAIEDMSDRQVLGLG